MTLNQVDDYVFDKLTLESGLIFEIHHARDRTRHIRPYFGILLSKHNFRFKLEFTETEMVKVYRALTPVPSTEKKILDLTKGGQLTIQYHSERILWYINADNGKNMIEFTPKEVLQIYSTLTEYFAAITGTKYEQSNIKLRGKTKSILDQ